MGTAAADMALPEELETAVKEVGSCKHPFVAGNDIRLSCNYRTILCDDTDGIFEIF